MNEFWTGFAKQATAIEKIAVSSATAAKAGRLAREKSEELLHRVANKSIPIMSNAGGKALNESSRKMKQSTRFFQYALKNLRR